MTSHSCRILIALVTGAILLPTPPAAYADPPPWAPAHGWRKKHDPYYVGYTGRKWDNDYGVIQGGCNRHQIGTILGGAVGGVVGSTIGKGDSRVVAIILGTVLGAVIGNQIGRELDKADRGCIGHALELAADRQAVTWSNPDNGIGYSVTPLRGFSSDGRQCREYELQVSDGRRIEHRRGKACRTGDGTWKSLAGD